MKHIKEPIKHIKPTGTNNSNHTNPNNLIDSLRFSIRITPTAVSSVSLKKNIISLWLLMTSDTTKESTNTLKRFHKVSITDFIYESLNTWDKETAKGFSDFVTERMIKDILAKKDFLEYHRIKNVLGRNWAIK